MVGGGRNFVEVLEMAMVSRQWRHAVVVVVVAVVAVTSAGGFVEGQTSTDAGCAAVQCPANSTCLNGKCKLICKAPHVDCNGKILDGCEVNYLDGDVANCGRCGRQCHRPKSYEFVNCVNGQCKYFDRCVAIKCATYPNAETTCKRAKCVVTCQPGFANCDGVLEVGSNGCEVNLKADANNCGRCGCKCSIKCSNGACTR